MIIEIKQNYVDAETQISMGHATCETCSDGFKRRRKTHEINQPLISTFSMLHANSETQTPVQQEICKICSDGFRQRKSAQTSLLKHKDGPWKINWHKLKSEIVNWKWTSISDLLIALVSLSLSLNDVVSDSLVASSFLNGTYYIKDVKTQNDSVVSSPECIEVGHNVFTFTQGKIKEEFYRYSCFETDPVWGCLSTAFIFISGIAWSFMIAYSLQRKKGLKDIHFWIILLLTPLSSSIFPIMVISMKLMVVFNNGKELKKLCDTFTYAEGQVEAFAQTGLQLYIIFKRSDRKPSIIQMISLSISVVALVWIQVKSYYCRIEPLSFIGDIKRKFLMAPVFLIKNIFFLGTVVLISIMDPVVCIANFGAYVFVIGALFATWEYLSGGIPGSEKSYNCLYVFLFVLIFLWPLTLLIWATIHVNIYLDSYSDVHLIKNHHFNKNAGIVILSGIIYFIVISIAWLEGKSFDVRGSLLLFPRKLQTSPRGKSGKVATWELCT